MDMRPLRHETGQQWNLSRLINQLNIHDANDLVTIESFLALKNSDSLFEVYLTNLINSRLATFSFNLKILPSQNDFKTRLLM